MMAAVGTTLNSLSQNPIPNWIRAGGYTSSTITSGVSKWRKVCATLRVNERVSNWKLKLAR